MQIIVRKLRDWNDYLFARHIRYWKYGQRVEGEIAKAFAEAYVASLTKAIDEIVAQMVKEKMAEIDHCYNIKGELK